MASYGGQAADGLRASRIAKAREREIEEAEFMKKKLSDSLKVARMDDKFSAHYDSVEQEIKANTVGLVTMDQMKQTQERALLEREKQLARREKDKMKEYKEKLKEKEMKKLKEAKKMKTLSFDPDDEEEEEEEEEEEQEKEKDKKKRSSGGGQDDEADISPEAPKRKRFGMNPEVNTTFLPDRDRDEEENRIRERLRVQWEEKQKTIKEEEVKITYSYWDGSGHRKQIMVKKGHTVYQFLVRVLDAIRGDFPELKIVSADQLMFVKEDLIIPQHNTFYDFIVSRARGKSGPLFNFDVHDDVRLMSDATVEKDESHAGKVVLRSWYDRNKHIFPASRWEPYDPTKSYEKYTIADQKQLNFDKAAAPVVSQKQEKKEEEETPGGGNVLTKLAKGSASGCRGMCKCSKSTVCEMHYQAKSFR